MIAAPAAREISGLAPSHFTSNALWFHNDSGDAPMLYAMTTAGTAVGAIRLKGAKNVDWEDMASFELDGQFWLLAADTGDNGGNRRDYSFLIVAEPKPTELPISGPQTVPLAWRITFKYPDGPHDCEAAAVDPRGEKIYFITKRTSPPIVYTVPLRPDPRGATVIAEKVAPITGIPLPSTTQKILPTPTGRYRAQVTGMDFSPDQLHAAVLSYGNVMLYDRRPGESWAEALNRAPVLLAAHGLPQAEAICFSADSRWIYVTGEGSTPKMVRYAVSPKPNE